MTTKTRTMFLAGFTVLVAGSAGAAYLGSRSPAPAPGAASRVQAFYAAGPIDAGTLGSAALEQGRIRTKEVAPTARPAGAVTTPTQLSGGVATAAIPEGTIVTADMFPAPQTRIGTVVIPAGKRALALQLAPVPGLAGFAGAGDRIDVYSVIKNEGTTPAVRLVLQGVSVLNVNGTGLPAAQGQPGGPPLVYLLAVTPAEAERMIFISEFEKLYFDLVPKGEPPVSTPGAGPTAGPQAQ